MRTFSRILFAVLMVTFGLVLASPAQAKPTDRYTISLITMSPGDPIFFRFGHNAILVRDSLQRTHRVYNWGTFSFHEEGLVQKFLRGRLTYWLSVQALGPTLAHYDSENRWLVEQELDLTPDQKVKIVRLIEENAQPENREYRYHYYKDNCSTRVRDVLDTVLEGKLQEKTSGPATFTYRQQTSRLVADVWWGHFFLNLAMGHYIDQPITQWDEMFVPEKVQEFVRKIENVDASGRTVPLVKAERTLVEAPNRRPPPDQPPNRKLPFAILGVIIGSTFGWLGFRFMAYRQNPSGRTPLGRRLALGLPLALWTFLTGFLGLLFLFFWTMTDHGVAYHNENLLQTGPWTFAFPIVAMGLMLDRSWATSAFRWLAYVTAALSILGLLLKVLPWFNQVNGDAIALLLPVWVGLAAGPLMADQQSKKMKLSPPKASP